jgi:cytosine/adenosine deaminase-related metal-dependent hydrolase
VTASHSFCLSDAPIRWLDQSIPLFRDAGLRFVTCYPSTPANMPVKKLIASGVPIAVGSDNIRGIWYPMGNEDLVLGAYIEARIMGMTSNRDLQTIWDMITKEGAKILNLESYGIQDGNKADMVVFDALSPQWAIIDQAEKLYVIKNGRTVAKKGKICT